MDCLIYRCPLAGDLDVDCHHTIEDTGIVLGRAIQEALGDKAGIQSLWTYDSSDG